MFKNIPLTLTTLGFTVALAAGCAAKHTDSSSSNNPGAVDEGADANQSAVSSDSPGAADHARRVSDRP